MQTSHRENPRAFTGTCATVGGAYGETLLFFYAREGEADLVRWLLEHGADPGAANKRGATAAGSTAIPPGS